MIGYVIRCPEGIARGMISVENFSRFRSAVSLYRCGGKYHIEENASWGTQNTRVFFYEGDTIGLEDSD